MKRGRYLIGLCAEALALFSFEAESQPSGDIAVPWLSTNGPAIYANHRVFSTNSYPGVLRPSIYSYTNAEFDHFLPNSLNELIWTNFIAHTNGRNTLIWNTRAHPSDWPKHGPKAIW